MALNENQPFVVPKLDEFLSWEQSTALWPMTMGIACCDIELMRLVSPRYDTARFGAEVFRSSPRQSDLMIVSGRVSNKMAPVLRQLYEQMPDPKWVISMGACASTGGVFDNYAITPADTFLPIDSYVPGCPPSPYALIYSLMQLRREIRAGSKTKVLAENA